MGHIVQTNTAHYCQQQSQSEWWKVNPVRTGCDTFTSQQSVLVVYHTTALFHVSVCRPSCAAHTLLSSSALQLRSTHPSCSKGTYPIRRAFR